jgi:plastocyanin
MTDDSDHEDDHSGRGRGGGENERRGKNDDDEQDDDAATGVTVPPETPGIVRVVGRGFSPQTITVAAGASVTWINEDDDAHTATGRGFDTGTLQPGQSATIVFSTPGIYDYVCQFHGEMTGQVIVTDAAGNVPAAPTPAPVTATNDTAGAAVTIVDFAFEPAAITVPLGATVTWTNAGVAPHTVAGGFGDSGTLASGQAFSHTFTEAGVFDYVCQFHPQMTGQVVVEGAAAAPGPNQEGRRPAERDMLGQVRLLLTLLITILILLRNLLP